jgi:protocatechuate 3,4-dioxygenase beta subunit
MTDRTTPARTVVTRKQVLRLLGASALTLAGALPALARAGGCVVRPAQTEGPYFTEAPLHRSDIREDPSDGSVRPGVRLDLGFRVSLGSADRCTPASGVRVDVWQCDHRGVYSDVRDRRFDTLGRQFLRGHQFTDHDGIARFITVVPGWYPGRATHIHFKLRTEGDNGGTEFTSQLYFDERLLDRVHALAPYDERPGQRTRITADRIYNRQGGPELMLDLAESGDGYAGTFDVTL